MLTTCTAKFDDDAFVELRQVLRDLGHVEALLPSVQAMGYSICLQHALQVPRPCGPQGAEPALGVGKKGRKVTKDPKHCLPPRERFEQVNLKWLW